MKKHFLHTEPKALNISNSRFIIGIILGILYAFAFYSFLYVTREYFRILSEPFNYDLWILTDSEVSFYNLFFAFVSVIFGQSICFTFWVDRPKRLFVNTNYRKTTIINDQRALMWYFLSWFSKLAIVFGLMFGHALYGGFYVFSFYPEYNYLFVMIIIVLFLQSWNTIRLSFKRKSIKWFFISAFIVTGLSYGFSKINIIDYKALNNKLLQNKIHNKYTFVLPESDTYRWSYKPSLVENIYIVKAKYPDTRKEPIIIIDNQEIALNNVCQKLSELQLTRNEADRRFMIIQLSIDKEIRMKLVNALKFEISKTGRFRIAYSVVPVDPEFDQRFYRNYSVIRLLPGTDPISVIHQMSFTKKNNYENIIEIKQLESGDCIINDSMVELNSLTEVIQRKVVQDPNYAIRFYINENVDFSTYLKVLTYSEKAVNNLRDYYSLNSYSKKYKDLHNREEIKDVRKKYPYRFAEH